MKIRLKEIAEATGYSINTVSHALRDEPDISETTKRLIREKAEQMGYIPNIQASGIKSGKSRIISIILPDISNPHFTIVFREIERFFHNLGLTPFFINTNETVEDELNAVRISIGQNVEGVIICPTQVNTECIRLLESSRIPYILIGRHFGPEFKSNYVVCDDTNGAYIATRHLLSLGHRFIAYVQVNRNISSDRERFAGYRAAMEEAGIPFEEAHILNLSLAEPSNAERIREYLAGHPACTAVLSFNDILAYRIIHEAHGLGLSVPEDLSVIGFDNICSDYPFPTQLSSVSVSKKHMANIASEILYGYIRSGRQRRNEEPEQIVLPTVLYLRETTAPLRSTRGASV